MHVVTVLFRLSPDHYSTFVRAILDNASTSLATEPGCLQFDVCEGGQGEFRVFLYEIYRTPADFDAHLAQPHFFQFTALTSPWVIDKAVQIFTRFGQPPACSNARQIGAKRLASNTSPGQCGP